MPAHFVFIMNDFSEEKSRFSMEVDVPADGTAFDARQVQLDAIAVAIKALSIGNLNYYGQTLLQADEDGAPTDPFAQREIGLRLFWREVSGESPRKGTMTIPCANLDLLAVAGQDQVPLTNSLVAAVIGAIETVWSTAVDPDREFYRAVIVGRPS